MAKTRNRSKGPRQVRTQNRINTLRTPYLRELARAIRDFQYVNLDPSQVGGGVLLSGAPVAARTARGVVSAVEALAELVSLV